MEYQTDAFSIPFTTQLTPSPFQFQFGPFSQIPATFGAMMEQSIEDPTSDDRILLKKRKRLSLSSDKIDNDVLKKNGAITTTAEEEEDNDNANIQKRRKAPSDTRKKDIFKSWLRMRQKGRSNPTIEEEVRSFLPEDLYGHFLDFLPEDLKEFDEQLRFERTCAEDALTKADANSWLLRRSSYNRHWRGQLIGTPPPKEDRTDDDEDEEEELETAEEEIDPDAQIKPTFFAFSYKREKSLLQEGQREIGHLLIVYTRSHGWALAEEDKRQIAKGGGTKIFCRHFFPSFISLLAHTLERVGVHPTRMISYEVPPLPKATEEPIF